MNKTALMFATGAVILGATVAGIALSRGSESRHGQSAHTPKQEIQGAGEVKSGQVAAAISGYAFNPKKLTVKKGTTVTWTNRDEAKHNVVAVKAGAGAPAGPLLAKGQSYAFTFDQVGSFEYLCEPHPYMKASVEVVE